MNFLFAWRYFKAKKSTNAINIIAWISIVAMTFGTTALILVLSVFNGFEGMVKSLYSTFYTDLKIFPAQGKVLTLTTEQIKKIRGTGGVKNLSLIAEEKGLLQNSGLDGDSAEYNFQRAVTIKGVDENFKDVSGVDSNIVRGEFNTGNDEIPYMILGIGVEDALHVEAEKNISPLKAYLPKRDSSVLIDPLRNVSADFVNTSGVFVIQQEFDFNYAITNLGFVKKLLGFNADEYTGAELAINADSDADDIKENLQELLGKDYLVQTRYEQNRSLYSIMAAEKWVVYAVLVLIMFIFSFTIVSSLTMLVLEKQKDISILHALGGNNNFIQRIFLSEGLLIGIFGGVAGIILALIIAWLQINYKLIPLQGGSFLIDYYPVKLKWPDFILVAFTVLFIALLASWIPARKASRQEFSLRAE
ncbi:MAG TPA: FtsX-like permease family protein [Chitinophagaceae bacterium]|nr:FtsX-like permease family protein [Chitinophagaceae bacterium]